MDKLIFEKKCDVCNGKGTYINNYVDWLMPCENYGGFGSLPDDKSKAYQFHEYPTNNLLTERIAILHWFNDEWRLSVFYPRGPLTHLAEKTQKYELSGIMTYLTGYHYSVDGEAGKLLDIWATKPIWNEGLKELNK